MHIEIDGSDISGPLQTPGTGGWGVFQEIWVPQLEFPEGEHVMRVFIDKGDFNLDYMDVREVSLAGLPNLNTPGNITISIYPNPCLRGSTLNILVKGGNVPVGILDIFDQMGKSISSQEVLFSEKQISEPDMRALTKPGIYLMRFSINNKIYWKKLSIL
jgi:hypothetical protein